jgi:hypothetical protein
MDNLTIGIIIGAALATVIWLSIDHYFINSVSRHRRLSLKAWQREVENDHTNKWEVRVRENHGEIYVEPWPVTHGGTIGLYQYYYGLGDKFPHNAPDAAINASRFKWEKWCMEKNTLISTSTSEE